MPILDEAALKEFHPLVKSVPTRIGKKQIKTLRDLEKTLLFLAPASIPNVVTGCAFAHGVWR